MIQPSVAVLTTGLMAFSLTAGHAADLTFATPDGLFRLAPSSSDRTSLLPASDRPVNALAWSGDGQRLGVVQNYGEVYRLDSASATPELVFSSDCQRPPTLELTWQRDDETLVIEHYCPAAIAGAPGELELLLSRATGVLIPLPALSTALSTASESAPFLSPDGSQVAYVTNQHIFVAGLDGSRARRITQTPGVYGAAGSPLAWSPDGTRLAFYEGNYPFQRLNVVGVDGGDRRVLTPAADFQIYRSRLFWSPDGRYIAFYRPHNPPFSNQEIIALVNVNTGAIQDLTRPGFYDALSWAPNSQQLVLASGVQAGLQTLFRLDLVNQEFTPLTDQPLQNLLESQWSPEGDWIAFTATPPDDALGTQVLHRVRPNGTEFAPLTTTDEYVYPFVWSPTALATGTQGVSEAP
ncbi:DPP IV N-terminal domain-containing protein [Nodosilinea sp. E11]|uniref:DPP IV N-terminal domain-containing protein n=1 Tax=Nodosilinea sp. E11 TaxID=3037479 RepID=UPI0029342FC4|nr:DPP IV N-terminal domain-containing protein [Nodosilinea sp. E11]WOD37798.1 DPP IV N-terminal domain-containing protein [Nodosilinea sp. E11]